MNKQNPNTKLELIIKNSDLSSLAKDYTELAVDKILDDGILKEIPIIGTVIGVMTFGNSVNKHFIAKKIYKFLYELNSISIEKRNSKIEEINSSKKYASSVGEMIFELLDKIESDGKPEIIGKLFASFLEEKINYETYLRLTHIVKNVFYYDLLMLVNYDENDYLYEGNSEHLSSLGLSVFGYNSWDKPEPKNNCSGEITEIGKMIVEFGMK